MLSTRLLPFLCVVCISLPASGQSRPPHTTSRPIQVRSLNLWTSLQVLAPSLRLSDSDVYAGCIAEIIPTIGVYDKVQNVRFGN